MSIATLKPQLLAWLDLRHYNLNGNRWTDGAELIGVPAWVEAVLFVDGSTGLIELNDQDQAEFETLLVKHEVWYELSEMSVWFYTNKESQ